MARQDEAGDLHQLVVIVGQAEDAGVEGDGMGSRKPSRNLSTRSATLAGMASGKHPGRNILDAVPDEAQPREQPVVLDDMGGEFAVGHLDRLGEIVIALLDTLPDALGVVIEIQRRAFLRTAWPNVAPVAGSRRNLSIRVS